MGCFGWSSDRKVGRGDTKKIFKHSWRTQVSQIACGYICVWQMYGELNSLWKLEQYTLSIYL